MKFIVLILVVATLYLIWHMTVKNKIYTNKLLRSKKQTQLVIDNDIENDLPEKSKAIKEMLDAERVKNVETIEALNIESAKTEEQPVSEQDQMRFDEVAKLFFESAVQEKNINQAEKIQKDVLTKMPINTQSQCSAFDFGEWSIFWNYHEQSLEYYVGRYGIFYAHVDHQGREHKVEFKN